jgi:hypothetical protein
VSSPLLGQLELFPSWPPFCCRAASTVPIFKNLGHGQGKHSSDPSLEVHKVSTCVERKRKSDQLGYSLPCNDKGKSNRKSNGNGMSNCNGKSNRKSSCNGKTSRCPYRAFGRHQRV